MTYWGYFMDYTLEGGFIKQINNYASLILNIIMNNEILWVLASRKRGLMSLNNKYKHKHKHTSILTQPRNRFRDYEL